MHGCQLEVPITARGSWQTRLRVSLAGPRPKRRKLRDTDLPLAVFPGLFMRVSRWMQRTCCSRDCCGGIDKRLRAKTAGRNKTRALPVGSVDGDVFAFLGPPHYSANG